MSSTAAQGGLGITPVTPARATVTLNPNAAPNKQKDGQQEKGDDGTTKPAAKRNNDSQFQSYILKKPEDGVELVAFGPGDSATKSARKKARLDMLQKETKEMNELEEKHKELLAVQQKADKPTKPKGRRPPKGVRQPTQRRFAGIGTNIDEIMEKPFGQVTDNEYETIARIILTGNKDGYRYDDHLCYAGGDNTKTYGLALIEIWKLVHRPMQLTLSNALKTKETFIKGKTPITYYNSFKKSHTAFTIFTLLKGGDQSLKEYVNLRSLESTDLFKCVIDPLVNQIVTSCNNNDKRFTADMIFDYKLESHKIQARRKARNGIWSMTELSSPEYLGKPKAEVQGCIDGMPFEFAVLSHMVIPQFETAMNYGDDCPWHVTEFEAKNSNCWTLAMTHRFWAVNNVGAIPPASANVAAAAAVANEEDSDVEEEVVEKFVF